MDTDKKEEIILDGLMKERRNPWKWISIGLCLIIALFIVREATVNKESFKSGSGVSLLGSIGQSSKTALNEMLGNSEPKETFVERIDLKTTSKSGLPNKASTETSHSQIASAYSQSSYASTPGVAITSQKTKHQLSIKKSGTGNGTINDTSTNKPVCDYSCGAYSKTFEEGTKIRLTALPDDNSIFESWSVNCANGMTINECLLEVSQPIDVTATFSLRNSPVGAAQASAVETQPSPSKNIIISEILPNPTGSDAGKEFIELYNPNNSPIDIKSWSLKLVNSSGARSSIAKIGSSPEDKNTINGNGYFLIGLNGYSSAPTADVKRSTSLPNSGGTIELFNESGSLIESVQYPELSEGVSIERRPDEASLKTQPNPTPTNSTQ